MAHRRSARSSPAVVGRLLGPLLPGRSGPFLVLVAIVGFVGLVLLPPPCRLDVDEWGGLMLNLFLAVAGITLCFPLGVLLALGRRSKLPLIRWLCVVYIELFRGVPLYVLLLLAYFVVPLFLPSDTANPSLVVRAIVAMTMFTAAYVAEIVRGGLQSLPKGQTEAAQALGLSPIKTMVLIVLPQALRNVIPALVGQFISLFKDTTLAAAAMGLLDVLNVSRGGHRADRLPGPGPDRRDAGVRHAAVLGRVHHDEPREPAAGAQAGSGDAMSDRDRSRLRRRHPGRRLGRGDDRAAGRRQALRQLHRAATASTSTSPGRRSSS